VLERNPDDADAVFAHAQSEYWVGAYYFNRNEFDQALPFMERYNELAQSLYQKNPQNFDYIMEAGWGANNLGGLAVKRNKYKAAIKFLGQGLTLFRLAEQISPDDLSVKNEISNTLGWLADASERDGPIGRALDFRNQQIAHYAAYVDTDDNYLLRYKSIEAQLHQTRLSSLSQAAKNLTPAFRNIIFELETLVDNDPGNMKWRLTLLRAHIDYYFYTENLNLKNELTNKIAQNGLIISEQVSDKALLELFYVDLVRYDARLLGRKTDITLEDLVDWQNIFMEESEELVLVHSELMIIFDKLGVSEKANVAAQNVIKKYTQTSSSLEPKAIIRLIIAGVITGQCENVSVNVNALMNRGYVAPDIEACLE